MIVYEGASALGGGDIVVVATTGSRNSKTGDMVQVWVLPKDTNPVAAIKTGEDAVICGDCKHRSGSCYVNVWRAPNAVWKAYKNGSYDRVNWAKLKGQPMRLGAYGDPMAIPLPILQKLQRQAKFTTGYTHQWRKFPDSIAKSFLMASVDTPEEYTEAKELGWLTFRVMLPTESHNPKSEVLCPSNLGVQCFDCRMCGGTHGSRNKKDVAIQIHGAAPKISKFKDVRLEVVWR